VIGEEDVMSYEELQDEIGKMVHGTEWPTIRIPKTVAKAGAWVKEKLASDEEDAPFIKPWMIDLADQNYPVSVHQARRRIGWEPKHSLRHTLPAMIDRLLEDPRRWYEINKLPIPDEVEHAEASKS
jgi:nucleoside-diphosphate-sugar epimerase